MPYRILLVDDEPDILEFVGYNLQKAGYELFTASDGCEGVRIAREARPHLILLDRMMPKMDGVEACRQIRELPGMQDVMVAFLSALGEDHQQIEGFEAGADDYIPKPISMRVLMSRIAALLKRVEPTENVGIKIDHARHVALLNGRQLQLPRKEYDLLALLLSEPGRIFSRAEILTHVWGQNVVVGDRTIDVHIRKLRSKIGEDSIETIKGFGYKFSGYTPS